jgi:hypothetical protein
VEWGGGYVGCGYTHISKNDKIKERKTKIKILALL